MTLSVEDARLYYQLWLPLLDYVNQKYKIRKNLKKMENAEGLEPQDVKAVADRMYEEPEVIDEYLSLHEELPEEHKNIISGWKQRVKGKFVIERHLKKGSILIFMENEKVYQVCGINTSIEDMFWFLPIPVMVEATLLPFKDVVITDGLMMSYRISIGRNMAKMFKDIYMSSKKNNEIIKKI